MSMAHEYYNKLPKTVKEAVKEGEPITVEEMRNFRKKLSKPESLRNLLDTDNNLE
jgi:hypothetical protein